MATATTDEATQLCRSLVDQLAANATITAPADETAMRTTPPHPFIPNLPLAQAYPDNTAYTKHRADDPIGAGAAKAGRSGWRSL